MSYSDDLIRTRARFIGCKNTVEDIAVYEGKLFEAFFTTTAIAAGANYDLGILTGDSTMIYIPAAITTSADSVAIGLYESSVITSGTTLTSYNHQRNSSFTSDMILKTAPTVTTVGTLVSKSYISGVSGNSLTRQGGIASGGYKMVLKPDTQYILRFTNGSTSSNTINVKMGWIESV